MTHTTKELPSLQGTPLEPKQVERAKQIAMYIIDLAQTEQREVISACLTVLATICFTEAQGDRLRGGDLMESLFRDAYKALRVLYAPMGKPNEDDSRVSD